LTLTRVENLRNPEFLPILITATTGEGVGRLVDEIERLSVLRLAAPALERRRRRARYLIARAAAELMAERIKAGDGRGLTAACDDILAGRASAADAAARLLCEGKF